MIKIDVKVSGLNAIKAAIEGRHKQVLYAASRAINDVAKSVAKKENEEIGRIFKNPTPRTVKATKVFKFSRKDDLEAVVGLDNGGGNRGPVSRQRKATVFPADYLLAQITGGQRATKRFEAALISLGLMPSGMQAVFATRSGALNQYGNLPSAKIVQIMSYLRETKGEGYGGKMTNARKQKMLRGELKGMKWGMSYFRGGKQGRINTGLPDGIWERHYPNGPAGKSFIRPILIYISPANYRRLFRFEEIANATVSREWNPSFNRWLSQALATAR